MAKAKTISVKKLRKQTGKKARKLSKKARKLAMRAAVAAKEPVTKKKGKGGKDKKAHRTAVPG